MSVNPDFDEIGRIMGEQLQMLDEERGTVAKATEEREQAAAAEMAAEQRYADKVQQVRDEGYVTDALLEKYGHKVGKKRGRPSAAAKAAASAAATA